LWDRVEQPDHVGSRRVAGSSRRRIGGVRPASARIGSFSGPSHARGPPRRGSPLLLRRLPRRNPNPGYRLLRTCHPAADSPCATYAPATWARCERTASAQVRSANTSAPESFPRGTDAGLRRAGAGVAGRARRTDRAARGPKLASARGRRSILTSCSLAGLGVDVIQIDHDRGVKRPCGGRGASATRRDLLAGGPI